MGLLFMVSNLMNYVFIVTTPATSWNYSLLSPRVCWISETRRIFNNKCRMSLKRSLWCMIHSCPSFLCAMDTGESMQLIKQGCALWTRLLMSSNKQCNQQLTLSVFGLTTVASAYQLLKIHLIFVGNLCESN